MLISHFFHSSIPGNSEIIVNSVVVLFILELDENCHCTLSTFAPNKAKRWQWTKKTNSDTESDADGQGSEEFVGKCTSGACSPPFNFNDALVGDVASLQKEVKALRNTISLLLERDMEKKDSFLAE